MIRAVHTTAQATLLVLLVAFLCLVGTASAYVDLSAESAALEVVDWTSGEAPDPSKNRVGVFGENPNDYTGETWRPAYVDAGENTGIRVSSIRTFQLFFDFFSRYVANRSGARGAPVMVMLVR